MTIRNLMFILLALLNEIVLAQCINDSDVPVFKGGEEARVAFLGNTIQYPDDAKDYCITGKVIVKFIVDTTGNLDSIQVYKKAHPFLNKEALRVTKLSAGHWIPACKNGKYNRAQMIIPFQFTVNGPQCKSKDYYYNLGVESFRKNETDMAFSCFKKALKDNPYDIDALYNLAVISLNRKDTAASITFLNEIKSFGGTDGDELLKKIVK